MTNGTYKADLTDIIFTGKHQEYGAFQLRKHYPIWLSIALWSAIFLFVIGTTSPMIYRALKPKEEVILAKKKTIQITELAEPPSIGEKKEMEKV